jgi:hypothetical protein
VECAKWQRGGARLGLKASARTGATGCHPTEGVAGVQPRGGEALLLVGRGRGARQRRVRASTEAGQAGSGCGPKVGRRPTKGKILIFLLFFE